MALPVTVHVQETFLLSFGCSVLYEELVACNKSCWWQWEGLSPWYKTWPWPLQSIAPVLGASL